MKNVRVKVRKSCNGYWFDFGIYDGGKMLMKNFGNNWHQEKSAIRAAKKTAEKLGIKYSDEIINQHGC